ncbi:MAG: hypothetical protein QOF21_3293 [Actinomycetota bacterium]|jgi:hypothetical protein
MTTMKADDPRELLDVVARKGWATRERLQPGNTDFLLLLLALSAAAGITGAYHSSTGRVIGIAITGASAVAVSFLFRSRMRLGGRIPTATWAISLLLFVTEVILGVTLHGTARDAAMGVAVAIAAGVLGAVLRSRWIVGLGAALLVIVIVGMAFLSNVGSIGSFGIGLVFGGGAMVLSRKKGMKR